MKTFEIEIYGLKRWSWGDGDCVLNEGMNSVETDDPKLIRAIHDAHDAKVGVKILKESK
jgi:hypothetical protein